MHLVPHRFLDLLLCIGEQHKKQRKMLNPVFSPSHLRDMMPTFYEVSYKVHLFVYFSVLPFPPCNPVSRCYRIETERRPPGHRHSSLDKPSCPRTDWAKWFVLCLLLVLQADHIHILFVYRSWYMSRHCIARLLTCGLGYSFDNLDDSPANEYSTVVKNLLFVSVSPRIQQPLALISNFHDP
jgi:hypothetical protein